MYVDCALFQSDFPIRKKTDTLIKTFVYLDVSDFFRAASAIDQFSRVGHPLPGPCRSHLYPGDTAALKWCC